jgi:hypothetical protein
MDIATAAKYMKLGYRIKRADWPDFLYGDKSGNYSIDDLLADDWEIITRGIIKDFPITYSD